MSNPSVAGRVAALAACCLFFLNHVTAQTPQSVPAPADPPTVARVEPGQRSPHFEAVNQHLALGGEFYLYADLDGDVADMAELLTRLYGNLPAEGPPQMQLLRQDYVMLAELLGISGAKAFGMSSTVTSQGEFENRAYLHLGGPRAGLAAVLGGEPQVLTGPRLAPEDVVFFSTGIFDGRALYATVQSIVARVAGDQAVQAMEAGLQRPAPPFRSSVWDLIQNLHGEMTLFISLDETQSIQVNPQLAVPRPAFVLRLENLGTLLNEQLVDWKALPMVTFTEANGQAMVAWNAPLPGPYASFKPVLASDGRNLYFTNDRDYLQRCLSLDSGRLADDPALEAWLAPWGGRANGITWVSPELPRLWKDFVAQAVAQGPQPNPMASMLDALPTFTEPIVGLRQNLPEGVLYVSRSPSSHKQTVVAASIYNPVTIGLMASMAIPAFQKVRTSSQEKAVLNNLRMLSAAADQYYLEHGVNSCRLEDLIGPGSYIPRLQPVAGEDYGQLEFRLGEPLSITLPDGRTIDYDG